MNPTLRPEVLECQTCGKILRELTPLEAQKVADKPYNYVVYCSNYCASVDLDKFSA